MKITALTREEIYHGSDLTPNEKNISNVYVAALGEVPIAYVCLEEPNILHENMRKSTMFEKNMSYDDNFIYIKQCAVDKDYQGRGIGNSLYEYVFKTYPESSFYSHVSIKNIPSLKLHYRNMFKKIGTFNVSNFHGYDNDCLSDFVYRQVEK